MTPEESFIYFVLERERVRCRREAGLPTPWTDDLIIRNFRFTNIDREKDRVTKWIADNWRNPNADDPDLWFAMAVARHVNLPETMQAIGYPVPWNAKKFIKAIRLRREQKLTAYNAAYMIRASGGDWEDKAEYLAGAVLGNLWKRRKTLRPIPRQTLESFHHFLMAEFGIGSFLGAQIVADAKQVGSLKAAPDWWTFAASGPGSRRGLSRLLGRNPKAPWREVDWREQFAQAMERIWPQIVAVSPGLALCRQCQQNAMCEYSKYEKTRLGEGRPKQKYVPSFEGLFSDGKLALLSKDSSQ